MRKKIFYIVVSVSLLNGACERQQGQKKRTDPYAPTEVEATGYTVPRDSMIPPKVVPIKGAKSITGTKPKAIHLHSNIYPVGAPRVIQAGMPVICTPGKDSFKLPTVVPAIDSPIIAGLPEVVVAKDPQIKDNNTASFSSFKILQGLSNNLIISMIQDKAGNLWLGSWGEG